MIEIPITSAFEYLKLAHNLKKSRSHPSEIEFYRGHSDKSWRLLPSIYRYFMLSFEEELIDEFIRRRPNEFSEEHGLFNTVAKMQHYGLHTRLLDVTENPAVALYFASCDDFDKDGELFCFKTTLDEIPSNNALNIITDFFVRHRNSFGHYDIKTYYDFISKSYNVKDVDMAFYNIVNGYSCYSRPKIISERILRQQGSFMLFLNEVCPKENCKNEKCIHRGTDKCNMNNIPRKINERIKNLSIRDILYDYTDLHVKLEQDGYRYIVKAESKKEILFELQTLGISKAFLFPELNNEGSEIMADYYTRLKNKSR